MVGRPGKWMRGAAFAAAMTASPELAAQSNTYEQGSGGWMVIQHQGNPEQAGEPYEARRIRGVVTDVRKGTEDVLVVMADGGGGTEQRVIDVVTITTGIGPIPCRTQEDKFFVNQSVIVTEIIRPHFSESAYDDEGDRKPDAKPDRWYPVYTCRAELIS